MAGVLASVLAPSSETDDRSSSADHTLLSRLKALSGTVRDRILGRTLSDAPNDDPTPPSAVRVDGFPDRDRPLSYPARTRTGINPTDAVGVETDAGLRVSIPENPDAEIVSDVWVQVEE